LIILASHQFYSKNNQGRDFFVGDIHGKYALFTQALNRIHFDFNADRLFSVGDVIDRGEASFNCLLLTQENWFIPVLGNHEQFLVKVAENEEIFNKLLWYQNGGGWWEDLDAEQRKLARNIVEQNYTLTLSVDTLAGKVAVVHAQYPFRHWPINECDINSDSLNQLLWGRDYITDDKKHLISDVDYIVSGHTPISQPLLKHQQLFIDTGCGHLPNIIIAQPHLTICEFKKEHIEIYAIAEQLFEFSIIKI
jgi:serine/threonine protein phosphatase 1